MKSATAAFAIATLLLGCFPLHAQPAETKEQRDARMGWWRDAKFGMFIHWNVSAVPAGFYQGKPTPTQGGKGFPFDAMWTMLNCRIPVAEYKAFAKDFNPVQYNAEGWVKLAKEAGMKYIVITAKHHDGFAMFDTKASDWNIVQATPFGKDPLKELAAACRKHGMRLGFYYSQAQDWVNGGSAYNGKWDKAQDRDMDDYIDKVAIPQVRELLSNYGGFPSVLWWDTPTGMNADRARRLYEVVHALRPGIIQNNRLGGGFEGKGDLETPEGYIPAQGYPGKDWETCMTMNGSWGYKSDDHAWKSTETLIRNLVDIASKGGNYLLNVGPTAEGIIPEPSVERLKAIGAWMKTNGEAIYGTGPTLFGAEAGSFDPVKRHDKGNPKKIIPPDSPAYKDAEPLFNPAWVWRCTTKPGKLFITIFDWPENGKFEIPAVKEKITKAYLLADPQQTALKATQSDTGVSIALPEKAPDPIASVVCLETQE